MVQNRENKDDLPLSLSLCSYAFWVFLGRLTAKIHKSFETPKKHPERISTQRQ